jgi:glycopeptide antibiotics resistance protein
MGILLKKSVMGFKAHAVSRRFLDAPSAFPALVFLILMVAGIWEPFDFSLDIGGIWNHIKPFLHDPWHFSWPEKDAIAGIQFLLASLFLCRLLQEAGWRRPARAGMLMLYCAGIGLEGSQIVVSRYPEVQDVMVGMLGTTLGGLLFQFPGFRERRWMWSLASVLGVFSAAGLRTLHPFQFKSTPSQFNWIPFLPQYESTTAAALGNFLANGMVYFPIGFLIGYFFPRARHASWVALAISGLIALALEAVQGWVVGRYSDVTLVLGAVLGSLLGSLVLSRGWPAFTEYMREDQDRQV